MSNKSQGMPRIHPADRERRIAAARKVARDPNSPPLERLAAMHEINKLMGLRPQ